MTYLRIKVVTCIIILIFGFWFLFSINIYFLFLHHDSCRCWVLQQIPDMLLVLPNTIFVYFFRLITSFFCFNLCFTKVLDLIFVKQEKVDFANNNRIGEWIEDCDRVVCVVATAHYLFIWQIEGFKEQLYQVWSEKVVTKFLSKICLVTCINLPNNESFANQGGLFE